MLLLFGFNLIAWFIIWNLTQNKIQGDLLQLLRLHDQPQQQNVGFLHVINFKTKYQFLSNMTFIVYRK